MTKITAIRETLIIENVDFYMLEKQRQELIDILNNRKALWALTPNQIDALDGILIMLNGWSDARKAEEMEVCSECGCPFDDNSGEAICKTCEDWFVED